MYIFSQKWFIPSVKSWTCRVVTEEDEKVKDEVTCKLYEEIREAIKVSASAFSDIVKTNQEVLASKDEGFHNLFSKIYHM
jgi:peroxin-14